MARGGKFIKLLVVAAAALALVLAFQGSVATAEVDEIDAGCESERHCTFYGTFYTSFDANHGCGSSAATSGEWLSYKNHCGWNIRIGWLEGGTTNWKACVGPGGERPEPGRFNQAVPFAC